MKKGNSKVVNLKHGFMTISFLLLLVTFFYLLFATRDDITIKSIKDYISEGNKILYITSKDSYSNYPIDTFEKYDIDYYYVNTNNLSKIEMTKLEKIVNINFFDNLIIIYENGKIKDALIDYKDNESINKFLQENEIIPEIIGDNEKILSNVESLLESDYLLMYLPYKFTDDIENQSEILESIGNEYDINYKIINAYLLSNTQKDKLNTILQISQVDDQIIILVKDKKIVGSVRGINNKKEYLEKLEDFKFIDEVGSYITYITYKEFNNLLSGDKSVITIGKDDCKYCDDMIKILDNIAINYEVRINYINIGNFDSNLAKDMEKKLSDLNYTDGFTTPLTIIVENNKLIDYVIGVSSEKYIIDIFTENGIIK